MAIVFLLLNLGYALLLIYYSRGWKMAIRNVPGNVSDNELPHVSVLLPVRNESENISSFIQSLQSQNFPAEKVEWIVVDDHSEEDTWKKLSLINDTRRKIVRLQDAARQGKKAALTAGVHAETSEWIITGDADCKMTENWIRALVTKGVAADAMMVCGLVKVEDEGRAITAFQAMETAVLQSCGAGSLQNGFPLLNTGASLAFRKSAWLKADGYRQQQHIASGDDTFLMLSFNSFFPGKVVPLVVSDAVVSTRPMQSVMNVIQQRLRWNGKVKHYPVGYIHFVGLLVMGAAIAFVCAFFQFIIDRSTVATFGLVFLLRFIAEWILLRNWGKLTNQFFSLYEIVLMSFFYPLFTLFSLIIRPFVNNSWKGRKL